MCQIVRKQRRSTLSAGPRLLAHDAIMAAGAVTLPVLELLMDDWIADTTIAAAA